MVAFDRMRSVVLSLAVLCAGGGASAQPLELEGRIEAARRAEISSQLDSVVAEILFGGGEVVAAGDPLIRLDAADAEIALEAARAGLAAAEAGLTSAKAHANRVEELATRGVASDAQLGRARSDLARARAEVALGESEVCRATLDLERAVIVAPISGRISRPGVAVGAFLEAEAGSPLASIVQLDPAIVAYEVPYVLRLDAMEKSGAASLEALFELVTLRLVLPGDRLYPDAARPSFASAEVDPATGAVTIWAEVANPEGVLRPGMSVRVLSEIAGVTGN
jgi:membrane fusion protein (multidrug efflux system)